MEVVFLLLVICFSFVTVLIILGIVLPVVVPPLRLAASILWCAGLALLIVPGLLIWGSRTAWRGGRVAYRRARRDPAGSTRAAILRACLRGAWLEVARDWRIAWAEHRARKARTAAKDGGSSPDQPASGGDENQQSAPAIIALDVNSES